MLLEIENDCDEPLTVEPETCAVQTCDTPPKTVAADELGVIGEGFFGLTRAGSDAGDRVDVSLRWSQDDRSGTIDMALDREQSQFCGCGCRTSDDTSPGRHLAVLLFIAAAVSSTRLRRWVTRG